MQNLGAAAVYLGGPLVTADETATGGLQLPGGSTTPVLIPAPESYSLDANLYAVAASGTVNVAVIN